MTLPINLPDVVAEVTAAFDRYEDALVNNKVDVLDELFWDSPHTLRYGATENLLRLRARSRPSAHRGRRRGWPARSLRTVITTYGHDFATANDRVPSRRKHKDGAAEPDMDAHSPKAGASSRRT